MQCQRTLFAAYRVDQYADPEGFMASAGMVFEQYADEVIVFVTDPRTGIQRKSKWPPTIAEIVESCDGRAADLARIARFENWGARNESTLEAPRETRPTVEQLMAKYGPNYGLNPNFESNGVDNK